MQQKKIILLASDCESSRWVYHALEQKFGIDAVVIEQPVSKRTLAIRRVKKIGFFAVAGQVLFSVCVVPLLRMIAKKRRSALINQYQLNGSPINTAKRYNVDSVNSNNCLQVIRELDPGIIIVNGTRIISKKILEATGAIFINMHAGITPFYRGSHGGYWALYNNDYNNFGTTIHLVDTGVDTGAVLKQAFIKPGKQDNFTTYPVLQAAIGIAALLDLLPAISAGNIKPTKNAEKGTMYYQPTLWQYLRGKVR